MRFLILFTAGCLAILNFAWADVHSETEVETAETLERAPTANLHSVLPPLSTEDEALIQSMPLKTKVGQLFIVGFAGQTTDESVGKIISSLKPGALIVFGRNISSARQISTLNIEAQKISMKATGLPLLIAVDQEGGDVIRIKTAMPLPSALALGETDDPALVQRAGRATGQLLKTLGFNMNLAPVMDMGDPKLPSFIGTRAFGHEPTRVVKMGVGFASGLQEAGVMPTAKHFPGHGGVNSDSHKVTPQKSASLPQLVSQDLAPFIGMRQEFKSPWAVMLAHISLPHVDPSGLPATFSPPIIDGLLRKKMSFDGLVMTDDIEMAGASAIKDTGERAIRAIEAGADMVMVAWNKKMQTKLVDAVIAAVKSGRLPEERINASLSRIVAAKRIFGPRNLTTPSLQELKLAVRNPEFTKVAEETVLSRFGQQETKSDLEFRDYAREKSILVFSPEERFYKQFKEAATGRDTRLIRVGDAQSLNVDKVMRSNPTSVGVFFVSGPKIAKLANLMSEDVAKRTLLVTVETEGALKNAASFRHIADVYYRHPQLGRVIGDYYFKDHKSLRVPAENAGEQMQ